MAALRPAQRRPLFERGIARIDHPNPDRSGVNSPGEAYFRACRLTSASIALPLYSAFQPRWTTFKKWPVSIPLRPEVLANYLCIYTGFSDRLICTLCLARVSSLPPNADGTTYLALHLEFNPFCLILALFLEQRKYIELFVKYHGNRQSGALNKVFDGGAQGPFQSFKRTLTRSRSRSNLDLVGTINNEMQANTQRSRHQDIVKKTNGDDIPVINSQTCVICLSDFNDLQDRMIIFVSCGHKCVCLSCFSRQFSVSCNGHFFVNGNCPYCKSIITEVIVSNH